MKNNTEKRYKTWCRLRIFLVISIMIAATLLGVIMSDYSANNAKSTLKNRINDNSEPNIRLMSSANSCGAVVIEQTSRRVLKDENMHLKRYPASTTKVLTALTVLNRVDMDETVAVPKEAVGVEGSSIYLREGEILTVGDLLYGLMLRSGNDAACALALYVGGSIEAFADMMNEEARVAGAQNSHFVNPHGLHDDNHYSTAYDLAVICAKAYENADFRKIVSAKTVKIAGENGGRYIGNKNKLLNLYEGANGVKTGFTKKSGRCLVGGAKRDGMQLITVVLNCPDMWNETVRLLDFGFDNFHMYPIETGVSPTDAQTVINVKTEFNHRGELTPRYYPVRRNGSEIAIADYKA